MHITLAPARFTATPRAPRAAMRPALVFALVAAAGIALALFLAANGYDMSASGLDFQVLPAA